MKAKNIIIYVVILLVVACGTFFVTKSIYDKKTPTSIDEGHNKKALEGGTTADMVEYTGEIPDFAMPVRGSYTGTFTDEDLKSSGIKVYQFQGSLKIFFGDIESKFIGIKFKDFLDYYNIADYSKVKFNDFNRLSVTYLKEEVTDNAYLIIKRGETQMVEKFLGFVDFTYAYNYSIEGVLSAIFE